MLKFSAVKPKSELPTYIVFFVNAYSIYSKILEEKASWHILFRWFSPLSSAEPYEFLVKLRNITWETNYVIVSQNALGMMGRRKLRTFCQPSISPPRRAPLNVLYYPYIIPTILYN
jgi:hypothetical protein